MPADPGIAAAMVPAEGARPAAGGDAAQRWAAAATAAMFISAASMTGAAGAAAVVPSPSPSSLPAPVDLATDAALAVGQGQPLVLLFSLPGCPYCTVVRRNYLAPLAREGRAGAASRPMLVREVGITGDAAFLGFARGKVSGAQLARHYKVRVAPTVLLLDGGGKLLAKPVVGGDVAGMYGAYLDSALDEAERMLAADKPAGVP